MSLPSKDIISRKTRQELREYFVSFCVLREITDEFDAADIPQSDCQPNISGQRRTLVEQYYHSLDFTSLSDTWKFLAVYQSVLNHLDDLSTKPAFDNVEAAKQWLAKLTNILRRDDFLYEGGKIVSAPGAPLTDLRGHAIELDAAHLLTQIDRIEAAIEKDPDQAIGSAKEIVETCCKTILSERGKPVDGAPDLPKLVSMTLEELKLLPDDVPEKARGAETIKKLLRTLATVPQALAELRQLYGTGHGKDGKFRGLRPRHARLAVGAARTVVGFLFESHKHRKPQ